MPKGKRRRAGIYNRFTEDRYRHLDIDSGEATEADLYFAELIKDYHFRHDYRHGLDEKVPSVRELGEMNLKQYINEGRAVRNILSMFLEKKGLKIVRRED